MKRLMLFVVFFVFLFKLHAVTILPPKYNLGSELGNSFGNGLQKGMSQAFYEALREKKQDKHLLNDQKYQHLLQWLKNQQEQIDAEWLNEFYQDIAKLDLLKRINQIIPITDISSFSDEHPAVQSLLAVAILYNHIHPVYMEICSKYLPKDQNGSREQFAISLLTDAAVNKKYISAKKLLIGFYQDRGDITKKLYWLHSAAEDGSAEVMRVLSGHYCSGIGVLKDMAEMIKWMALAAAKGDEQANQIMQFMMKDTRFANWTEFSEGLKRAEVWQKHHIGLFIHS